MFCIVEAFFVQYILMFFCLSNILVTFLFIGGGGVFHQVYCKLNNIITTTTTATTGNSYFSSKKLLSKIIHVSACTLILYIQLHRKYVKI